jgi:hypothetical protein|tara:strand:+ start:3994 stop:4215 length:222 start_codon:yes stop_codon:yes gene_type:complete
MLQLRTSQNMQQNQSQFAIARCLKERQCALLPRIRARDDVLIRVALHETAICHAVMLYSKNRAFGEFCAFVRL